MSLADRRPGEGASPAFHGPRPFAPVALVLSLALCFAAAGIGGAVTTPEIGGWYASLRKPPFNPPDWVFGPVWTVLYGLMAVVLWQIYRTPAADGGGRRLRSRALFAFVVQLVLNVAWSIVFFGLHSPAGGIAVIAALLAAIVWLMRAARPVIGGMTWLLAPYLAWVAFAAVLNVSILALNG
ncbi:TspO/MBR family protein [Chthonobacter rhizosphaerae]|uniref:TspO/MBR family protein n=1 Tax=Chthonobacter rhizosphaerae TaxID=2735553 RepID=UPI0015EF56E4|nr:TspO/MBR family protein [Chthonobacter rhizosphaerae]